MMRSKTNGKGSNWTTGSGSLRSPDGSCPTPRRPFLTVQPPAGAVRVDARTGSRRALQAEGVLSQRAQGSGLHHVSVDRGPQRSDRRRYDTSLQLKDGEVIGFHCFHASHAKTKHRRDVFAFFGLSTGSTPRSRKPGMPNASPTSTRSRCATTTAEGVGWSPTRTSGIWVPDPVEQLTQMTVEMMRARQRQSLTLKAMRRRRRSSGRIDGEARKRLTNALALARSVPPLADAGEHWDEIRSCSACQNGVIDLRTGQLRKATPADRVTMRVRVAYDPAATCPLWLKTLAGIFAPPGRPIFTDQTARVSR